MQAKDLIRALVGIERTITEEVFMEAGTNGRRGDQIHGGYPGTVQGDDRNLYESKP